MTLPVVVLLAAVALVIGIAFATLLSRSRTATLAEQKSALERELAAARIAMDRQSSELRTLTEARSALDATLVSERRTAEEKLQLLKDAGEQLKSDFKALAAVRAWTATTPTSCSLPKAFCKILRPTPPENSPRRSRPSAVWLSRSHNRCPE